MKNYELAVCVMILGAFLCGSLVGASVQERKDRAILEELQQQIEVMNKPLAVTADGVHRTCAVSQPFEDKNGKPGTPVPTVINREVQNAG